MRQQKQPPKPSFLDAATHDGMIRTGMKKLDDEDPGVNISQKAGRLLPE